MLVDEHYTTLLSLKILFTMENRFDLAKALKVSPFAYTRLSDISEGSSLTDIQSQHSICIFKTQLIMCLKKLSQVKKTPMHSINIHIHTQMRKMDLKEIYE